MAKKLTKMPSKYRLIDKIKRSISHLSREIVEQVFLLYCVMVDKETPTWCKTTIIGALVYFLSLIDGIPDFTPLIGFTDDVSVMAAAIATVSAHITPEHREEAARLADKWLPQKDKF